MIFHHNKFAEINIIYLCQIPKTKVVSMCVSRFLRTSSSNLVHHSRLLMSLFWCQKSFQSLKPLPIAFMGRTVYFPTWMVEFYGKCKEIYHGCYGNCFFPQTLGTNISHLGKRKIIDSKVIWDGKSLFIETNSLHLKIGRNPKGKACLPTIHFQGLR